jgi:predicted enzyme related to lactoylglutathione lyase
MSQFKSVNVVSIDVVNWDAAKKFYSEVLGWPLAYGDDNVGWYEWGVDNQAHVSINRWRGPAPAPAHAGATTLILAVDDAPATTTALRAKGVKCDDVVTIPGIVTYGGFYDPEGNRIQFVSTAPPAA